MEEQGEHQEQPIIIPENTTEETPSPQDHEERPMEAPLLPPPRRLRLVHWTPPRATAILLGINLAVWLLSLFLGQEEELATLLRLGANFSLFVRHGELWRLGSSIFLHVDITHLLFNLYALYYLGSFFERSVGPHTFMVVYGLSGLAGSLASALLYTEHVSAGASGAIMGLVSASMLILFRAKGKMEEGIRRRLLLNFALIVLLSGALYFFQTHIDHAAHGGGLLAGFLVMGALLLVPRRRRRGVSFVLSALVTSLLVVSVIVAARGAMSRDLLWQGTEREEVLGEHSFLVPSFWEVERLSPSQLVGRALVGGEIALVLQPLEDSLTGEKATAILERSILRKESCAIQKGQPLGDLAEGYLRQALICRDGERAVDVVILTRESRGHLILVVARWEHGTAFLSRSSLESLLEDLRSR